MARYIYSLAFSIFNNANLLTNGTCWFDNEIADMTEKNKGGKYVVKMVKKGCTKQRVQTRVKKTKRVLSHLS